MQLKSALTRSLPTVTSLRLDRWTVEADGQEPREVTVPSAAVPLGWERWDESTWETVWTWRTFVELDTVPLHAELEIGAALGHLVVYVNDTRVGSAESGFLPCVFDVVSGLKPKTNKITIVEDARWRNVPPMGSPLGTSDVDFFMPAGIYRPVVLRFGSTATLRDVVIRSTRLLTDDPVLTVTVPLPEGLTGKATASVRVTRDRDDALLAEAQQHVTLGHSEASLVLLPGRSLELWSLQNPALYHVDTWIEVDGEEVSAGLLRTGFREIAWKRNGLHINGQAKKLIGLNRHELFPFVGFSASDRVQRNDARILKEDLGIDIVRCSHYPQSDSFLDACDELGLLVFEEAPGWQYAGTSQRDPVYADPWHPVPHEDRDPQFERRHVDQFRRMIRRDRHRPSVVIWGGFINETRAFTPDLWDVVIAEARALDPERALGGATRYRCDGHETGRFDSAHDDTGRKVWPFDVFGYNDYRLGPNERPDFMQPVADYPYLITEAVGQMPRFTEWFTRGDRSDGLSRQALYHADAIDFAFADNVVGVINWSTFDYPSPHGSLWGSDDPALSGRGHSLKTPGVLDVFRIAKPAAAVYRAQRPSSERVVLEPAFAWDPGLLNTQPLRFASNCTELLVSFDDGEPVLLLPDRVSFPRMPHPLFVLDLPTNDAVELHAVGRIGGRDVAELRMTRDASLDHLEVRVDDTEICGDGVDSTRVSFQVSDAFGNLRASAVGPVAIKVRDPGVLIGPELLDLPGSAGAVWVKSVPGADGIARIHLSHPTAGDSDTSVVVTSKGTQRE